MSECPACGASERDQALGANPSAYADRSAELEARVEVLEKFNGELRRYLYDRTPERREKVVERFALNPSARSE